MRECPRPKRRSQRHQVRIAQQPQRLKFPHLFTAYVTAARHATAAHRNPSLRFKTIVNTSQRGFGRLSWKNGRAEKAPRSENEHGAREKTGTSGLRVPAP